jgi:hypothetical protein
MNDNLEETCKETDIAQSKHYPDGRKAGWTELPPNANEKRYRRARSLTVTRYSLVELHTTQ